MLSPLRGYRGSTFCSPWADAHGYVLSPHSRLLGNDVKRLAERIGDRRVLALLQGYLRRTVYDGGYYQDVQGGVALGCPLASLINAVDLSELDQAMEARDGSTRSLGKRT